jgi:solute carrier family 13 (sodium-dependent dicarboxylate transporter), member 2/3/5
MNEERLMISTRLLISLISCAITAGLALYFIADPVHARAAAIAAVCLILWLSEAVPPFVPAFLLLACVPLALPSYNIATVMQWMAEPVLLLFLGGLSLGIAAQRYGIDAAITVLAVQWSGGKPKKLLFLVMAVTSLLSMWMSNTAAAAMMLAALRPLIADQHMSQRFRIALLVGIALSANIGGMGTPIGSPPNAIAVATLEHHYPVTLLTWMMFGLPLVAVLLTTSYFILLWYGGVKRGTPSFQSADANNSAVNKSAEKIGIHGFGAWSVVIIFSLMVAAWVSEPLHGMSVATVAIMGTALLFGSGLLRASDARLIDWSTLLLIAGGLGLGRLIQEAGIITDITQSINWQDIPSSVRVSCLILIAAIMSAVMSNTATAILIIPLAFALDPNPATPILVALGTSLGVIFAISTPPNALVYSEGGMRAKDLFVPGIIIMLGGWILLSVVGALLLGQ